MASAPARVTTYLNGRPRSSYLKRTDEEFWNVTQFRFLEGGPYARR